MVVYTRIKLNKHGHQYCYVVMMLVDEKYTRRRILHHSRNAH